MQTVNSEWLTTRQLDAQTWAIDDRGQDLIYLVCDGLGRGTRVKRG